MCEEDEWAEHAAETWREQTRIYRAMAPDERLAAAFAFDRQARAWTAPVDLAGTTEDAARDAAAARVERAFGPDV